MNATDHCRNGRSERGFTLLEVLVVVVVLALGLMLVAPSLNRARLGIAVRSAALELAAHLRSARAAARSTNVVHVLMIDLAGRRYWVDGVMGRRQLPASVALDLTVPQSERVDATAARIRFFPDGSTSGAMIVLHDGLWTASIRVDWLSGDVRLRLR